MPAKQHVVCLSAEERHRLSTIIRRTGSTALQQRRARILLHADISLSGPRLTDREVAAATQVELRTVARVRELYAVHGLAHTLARRPRSDRGRGLLTGDQEAQLIPLACSTPPAGMARWTLRLLANEAVRLEIVETVSHETVRTTLKKTSSSRG